MDNEKGYTVMELLMLLWFLVIIAAGCIGIYVAVHFIQKYW